MATPIHKGSELRNVSETWDENERKLASESIDGATPVSEDTPATNPLDQIIKEEAAAYDNNPKESQLLSGDRATVTDDERPASDEPL